MTIDQLGIIRRPGRAHARDRDRPILGPLDGRDRGPRQGEAPIRIEAREQDGGPTAAGGPPEVPAVPGRVSRGGGLLEAPGIPLGVVLDGRFAGAVMGTAGGGGGGVLPGLAGLPLPPRHLSPVGSFKRGGREKPRNQQRERERGFEPVEVERVEIDRERKKERESRWRRRGAAAAEGAGRVQPDGDHQDRRLLVLRLQVLLPQEALRSFPPQLQPLPERRIPGHVGVPLRAGEIQRLR